MTTMWTSRGPSFGSYCSVIEQGQIQAKTLSLARNKGTTSERFTGKLRFVRSVSHGCCCVMPVGAKHRTLPRPALIVSLDILFAQPVPIHYQPDYISIDFERMNRKLSTYSASRRAAISRAAASRSSLDDVEQFWASRQPFLESKGYMLRHRYRSGWVPSWSLPGNEDIAPSAFEDYVPLPVSRLVFSMTIP